MSARIKEHATYEDLLRAPENMVAELVDGELYTWPRPRGIDLRAAAALCTPIAHRYVLRDDPEWCLIAEPEIGLTGDAVVPSLAGWRMEHVPKVPHTQQWTIVPDWVCEIVSSSTRRLDRGKKIALYARCNVPWAWYIDVDSRLLEILQLVNGEWVIKHIHSGNDAVRAEPFPEARST